MIESAASIGLISINDSKPIGRARALQGGMMRACVMAIAAIGGTALGAIAELARRHALEKGQLGMLCCWL